MSPIRSSLEKLYQAIETLDGSVSDAPVGLQGTVDQLRDDAGNVVDVDFVANRLDKAIATVENLLKDEG